MHIANNSTKKKKKTLQFVCCLCCFLVLLLAPTHSSLCVFWFSRVTLLFVFDTQKHRVDFVHDYMSQKSTSQRSHFHNDPTKLLFPFSFVRARMSMLGRRDRGDHHDGDDDNTNVDGVNGKEHSAVEGGAGGSRQHRHHHHHHHKPRYTPSASSTSVRGTNACE